MNNENAVYKPIAIASLVVALCSISFLLFALDDKTGTVICKILVILIAATCLILLGYGVSCNNKIEKSIEKGVTKEKIESIVRESVNRTIQIEADKSLSSQLGAIKQQIAKLDESLHKDLQDVLIGKNTNLKFIQEMAYSIGKDGSAWKEEQVKKFMICLNAITCMQNEDVDETNAGTLKREQSIKEETMENS